MIKKYTIFGERCSGTNYLENLININFDVHLTWEFGFKHFFGFVNLENSDDTLFICIVRNPIDWINSFYREMYHLPLKYKENLTYQEKLHQFMNEEIYSFNDKDNNRDTTKEIMNDRHIYTGKRYKNIFELRYTKINWMINDLPKKVNNYILIRYEDLINNFEDTIIKIKNKGLSIRKDINFPLNWIYYKKNKKNLYTKKENTISDKIIISNPNFILQFEKKLNYNFHLNDSFN